MKCPFDLPVYKDEWAVTSFCIRNSKGILFTSGIPEASADYIVHVINSHKKLVELAKLRDDLLVCYRLGKQPSEKLLDRLHILRKFEQALDAEK